MELYKPKDIVSYNRAVVKAFVREPKKIQKFHLKVLHCCKIYVTMDIEAEIAAKRGAMKKEIVFPDILSQRSLVVRIAKCIVFCSLALIGIIVTVNSWDGSYAGFPAWYFVLPAVVILLAENAVKIWAIKKYTHRIFFYALDIFLLLVITIVTNGMLISTFYIIILSEFYIRQESLSGNLAMGSRASPFSSSRSSFRTFSAAIPSMSSPWSPVPSTTSSFSPCTSSS